MGSGASTDTSTAVKPKVMDANGVYTDDLLKVSLDSPEYTNGKPDLRYQDAQGRTLLVETTPEETIGCFTTLDKAGRVTSAPGRLFRLVLPMAMHGDRTVEAAEKSQSATPSTTTATAAAAAAPRETSAGSTDSGSPAAAAGARPSGAAALNEEATDPDNRMRRWFFYNDTKDFNMVVTAYFGAYSQLHVLGSETKMWRELPSGLVIAELVVPPLKTLPFVEGLMSDGYDLRFKALKA